jgi:aspartate ammonia-lyase
MTTRLEHDLLGERQVPAEAYWGIHTLRAIENFPLGRGPIHPQLIRALAEVKKACALTNVKCGLLEARIGEAIVAACDEIIGSPGGDSGKLHDQFPVDALQGGAGTSSNMNANEVIANRAIELLGGVKGDYSIVHPNDHVNMSQSTNDVFPTAVRVAAIRLLLPLVEAMTKLQAALQAREAEFAHILKLGRTETQDALPVTVGQAFAAWAQAIQRDWWRLYKVEERLRQVNLGGTAVGTGLNAQRRYVFMVVETLRDITGFGMARAENMIDVTQNCDVFVEVSGLLKAAAVNFAKLAADLRFLSSGPRGGIGELKLPERQAGSSIMPGKVNPVITEALTQCAYQVMANDLAITLAAQAGQLELNAFIPLIAHNLFEALELLHHGAHTTVDLCLADIRVDEARCAQLLELSTALATAVVPYVGYEIAGEIARESLHMGTPVRQILLARGLFTAAELDAIFAPVEMTTPGIAGERRMRDWKAGPGASVQGA